MMNFSLIQAERQWVIEATQIFKPKAVDVGGRGELPSRSLGGYKGAFSHARECPLFFCVPARPQGENLSVPLAQQAPFML